MIGVIQNGQATHAQALYSLEGLLTTRIEQRIERIADALSDFVGGSFHFVPRGGQLAPALAAAAAPLTGASPLPNRPVALPITALAQAAEPPPYRMSRTIQTIPELWREWTVGLAGQPSIEQLDARYGASWRTGPTIASKRQFYSRRKTLITEIRRLAAAGGAPAEAEAYDRVVLQLEDERKRAGASLSKVIDALKRA